MREGEEEGPRQTSVGTSIKASRPFPWRPEDRRWTPFPVVPRLRVARSPWSGGPSRGGTGRRRYSRCLRRSPAPRPIRPHGSDRATPIHCVYRPSPPRLPIHAPTRSRAPALWAWRRALAEKGGAATAPCADRGDGATGGRARLPRRRHHRPRPRGPRVEGGLYEHFDGVEGCLGALHDGALGGVLRRGGGSPAARGREAGRAPGAPRSPTAAWRTR